MITNQQIEQRSFLVLFGAALVGDFLAKFALAGGYHDLGPLAAMWLGPLDDVFYALAGIQAFYFLLDPGGETRSERTMSTVATIKTIAGLLAKPCRFRAHLWSGFFTGSLAAMAILTDLIVFAMLANWVSPAAGWVALMGLAQQHLSQFLLLVALGAAALITVTGDYPRRFWFQALAMALGILILSTTWDGRWQNLLFEVFNAPYQVRAWGLSLAWIATLACFPLAIFQTLALSSSSASLCAPSLVPEGDDRSEV